MSAILITRSSMELILAAERAKPTPPHKPTWKDFWDAIYPHRKTILNLWECVRNRRWSSIQEIGSETDDDLLNLLAADIAACGCTEAPWASEED